MQPRTRVASRPDELDDLTLARARRGDEGAFCALVECYQRAVFAFLWRMVGRRGDAAFVEDLTQETFMRVYRGVASFDPNGPARLRTWIFTIATRVALNALRSRALPVAAVRERSVESGVERVHAGMMVRRVLDELSEDHRAVFLLREYHELDYDEIAAALGIEIGTVKSRLSRARKALREALARIDR
jgi:RNA polymerase sigma-70 factor (ECF subfamily)